MMGLNQHHVFWLLPFWCCFNVIFVFVQLYKAFDTRWIIRFPKKYELPTEQWIPAFEWLVDSANFYFSTFRDITRAIASLIEGPCNF